MSKPLGISQILETLEALKAAARDFSARTIKLNEELRVRLAKSSNRQKTSIEESNANLAARLAEAETKFQSATHLAKSNYEKRKVRLGKAYRTSKEQGLAKVEQQIGKRKYTLQRHVLQAERDRDAALKDAASSLNEYRTNLANEQNELAQLDATTQTSFRGYRKWLALFSSPEAMQQETSSDEFQMLAKLRESMQEVRKSLKQIQGSFFLRLLRYPILWVVLLVCLAAVIPVTQKLGIQTVGSDQAKWVYIAVGALLVLTVVLRLFLMAKSTPLARSIANKLGKARTLHEMGGQRAEGHYQEEVARINADFSSTVSEADKELKQALSGGTDHRARSRTATDEKSFRVTAKHEQLFKSRLERLQQQHSEIVERLKSDAATTERNQTEAAMLSEKKFEEDHRIQIETLRAEWQNRSQPLFEKLNSNREACQKLFPQWSQSFLEKWKPPHHFEHAAKLGDLRVDLEKTADAIPGGNKSLAGQSQLSIPLSLIYPEQGSIVFETGSTGRDAAIASLNNLVLRLLSVSSPGRLNFTVFDPIGLGQNFAGVMHLADYEEQLINNRIWTQSSQIEQKLADLNEHMEKVIQMYLRNEYSTIADYNEQAGVIAEKYQFLVVADFPTNFSDIAARRLMSIAQSGARCGVYLLLHWDLRQPLSQDFSPEELRKSAVRVVSKGSQFILENNSGAGAELELESPPAPEQAIQFIQAIGQSSRDSSRVEVPFAHVTPDPKEIWSEETSSELRVPIGRTGATKLQYLAIGKGTRQHGLIAGKTGSGKSTLFHVIITNLSLWCSPEQVEFYLVDFKKGVEFKCYGAQRLPHARVVAIESDREFGLSVLQKVDDELKRRGDLFRKLGVQDVAGYKRAGGSEPIPRSLLLIDEFQEFFVEDDKISQTASLLLDRIVRQGRAFGIHVLLGSQTLGGAYTVARTTLGQMVIRIALQCNEADAYLIMDDNNPAPRLLSRPGEGIYNDTAGTIEGNSPFQVVWLSDEERDAALRTVRQRADQNGKFYPGPFVFEGNAPADVRENLILRSLLETPAIQSPAAARIWLGAPNSIKGPTEAVFHRQSGNNLLLIGQREEATLAIFSLAMIALAAQYPAGSARIILCDASAPDSPPRDFLERTVRALPLAVTLARPTDLPKLMQGLVEEMKLRMTDEHSANAPPVFLLIHGMQRFNKLRYEEDFGFSSTDAEAPPNPSILLNTLVTEGTVFGFHVIASCDTYNNVNRFLNRKALSEFEMRVLFQMSANDSASLIDSPKASTLGLHRALYYNEQEGYLETFRPYALPTEEWMEGIGRLFATAQSENKTEAI